MIFLYIFENGSDLSIMNTRFFYYFIKPLLWISTAFIVWTFPNVRAKGRLKHRKILNLWAFNFAVIYIIVSLMVGLIDGLGKSPYSHTPAGILTNIAYVGSMLIGRELIRSYLVNNITKKENYLVFITIAVFMTITSISIKKFWGLKEYSDSLEFIGKYFAPEFCQNLLAVYLVYLGGPLTSIIYLGITQGFHWLSPILPSMKWITQALIGILCPLFFLMAIQNIYLGVSKEVSVRKQDKENPLSWLITSIVSIALVWFSAGVFPLYPSVIVTGSMEPMIKPGDVILVKKIDGNNVQTGDVIQFRKDSILIAHRVIEVKEVDKGKMYRTQGDNNSGPDVEPVKPEDVKGKVIYVAPKVGWPTLLIKSKQDIDLKEIVF
ncbi:MAG: signal peptidase I [Bacillota bacterium]